MKRGLGLVLVAAAMGVGKVATGEEACKSVQLKNPALTLSEMYTMSEASTAVTYVPLRGWTATRFSSASRLTASRSGVRPRPRSRMSSSSRSAARGGRRSVTIRSRIAT